MDDTFIQQDLAHTAVSGQLAGVDSWIIWSPETEFSVMGYERGGTDVLGPGGMPYRPETEFSVMGIERGGTDVLGLRRPAAVPVAARR